LRSHLVAPRVIRAEDASGAWSLIQSVPLAFDLGAAADQATAEARTDSLYALRLPTYAVAVPYTDGATRWHVYAGAFRDSTGAEAMRQMLVERDLPTRLVERRGLRGTPQE
jgi:hypothetical protein